MGAGKTRKVLCPNFLRPLPQVAKAEEGGWDEGSIYESGAVYPSEEALLNCVRNGKNKM